MVFYIRTYVFRLFVAVCLIWLLSGVAPEHQGGPKSCRERINIDEGWRFRRFDIDPDHLEYDARPKVSGIVLSSRLVLKNWILPSANPFIRDPAKRHHRPEGNPGEDLPFVEIGFDDSQWELVDLPHDWSAGGPFYGNGDPANESGMGSLPCQGVGWYRRKLDIPAGDIGRCIYLDMDGAMSYAMVWLNGKLVGGWPYGYNSFRLDLTHFIRFGAVNQLAIRLDNPPHSSRWYPGGGIYRHVWLTKVNPVHVAQWGSLVSTRNISLSTALVDLEVGMENTSKLNRPVSAITDIYEPGDQPGDLGRKVATIQGQVITIAAGSIQKIRDSVVIGNPRLWGPPPFQKPDLYTAITRLVSDGETIDEYRTVFGIRSLNFDPDKGLLVNGLPTRIQGVNQHNDLGALGVAFNRVAAERQLKILQEAGCNAIRMAHNPPAPELLDLADHMGFLVIDEIFDCWEKGKKPLDFHLIFDDWHEADTRAFIRRDRNHPSVIAWSVGNEVGEQYTGKAGAALAKELHDMVWEEDSSRPAMTSMNYAKPDMPFAEVMDIISLNYQGEGIRDAPAYSGLAGIRTPPLYDSFHTRFPGKMILSSETASTLSTRGTYLFPVVDGVSAPVRDHAGGDPEQEFVSSYELYTAQFGASPDKVFACQDRHPFVAGEFVWSGWDYLGEPTPYNSARSSYSGIIDLAGFKKDRFYLYQSRWRPDLPMAHILPHWTWPDRVGKITPVHVFSSGDEAELFLNGRSLGRRKRGPYEYRFRWDSVVYEPGELRVIAFKSGKPWATDSVRTAGQPFRLHVFADRDFVGQDPNPGEYDLSFITVRVEDEEGQMVPAAGHLIRFEISAGGEIVATDNGDPRDLVGFGSAVRKAFRGLALAIIRAKRKYQGPITITALSDGLEPARVRVWSR
jgi:beta-galactosidase